MAELRPDAGLREMLAMSLLVGDARATAALRPVTVVVLLLNIIPAALLFADLRDTLLRIYSGQQVTLTLASLFVAGRLIPVFLLLVGGGAPWILGAVLLILAGSLAVRFLFIKIPHVSHESRRGLSHREETMSLGRNASRSPTKPMDLIDAEGR